MQSGRAEKAECTEAEGSYEQREQNGDSHAVAAIMAAQALGFDGDWQVELRLSTPLATVIQPAQATDLAKRNIVVSFVDYSIPQAHDQRHPALIYSIAAYFEAGWQ